MTINHRALSDAQLEDVLLAGARGLRPGTASTCAEHMPRYASTAEHRLKALQSLLGCAGELRRRQSLQALVSSRTLLDTPSAAKDYLRLHFDGLDHECFVVIFLCAQHRVITVEEMFRGTLTQTAVYPREVLKRVLDHASAAVFLAHNHPSGVAEPSRADEFLTQSLKSALALADARVLDHFIVAGDSVTSLAERGLV